MLTGTKKMFLAAAVITAAIMPLGLMVQAAEQGQTITKNGTYATVQANAANFTGRAWVENLFRPHGTSKVYAASVSFEPGARTHWHSHATGQSLIVTAGYGYTQEWGKPVTVLQPGDVVWCPPGVKHWHGAGPDTSMTHIAVSEARSAVVTWMEAVDADQYPR